MDAPLMLSGGPEVKDEAPACLVDCDAIPPRLEALGELLHLIHSGSLEPVPWESSFKAMQHHFHANWVALILRPPAEKLRGVMVVKQEGKPARASSSYQQAAYAADPFVKLPLNRIMTIDEVTDKAQWMKSAFHQENLAPYDIVDMMGVEFRTEGGINCHLRLCRSSDQPLFSTIDRALFKILVPHFRLSIHMHSLLDLIESERKFYAETIDGLLVGTLILDEGGALLKTNSIADAILHERDGIELRNGELRFAYANEQREFSQLIRTALASGGAVTPNLPAALSVSRPSGRAKLGIMVRTIPCEEWSEGKRRPSVAICIRDPEWKFGVPHAILQDLFNLSRAEASLAVQIANGLSLEEAAQALGVQKTTARTHLQNIFAKTGVTRQSTLVRLLHGSIAPLGQAIGSATRCKTAA